MKRKVIFRPRAEADLRDIYDYIEQHSPTNAFRFVRRIENFCLGLADFPERGMRRDDLRKGIRIVGFERRVVIAFAVLPETIEISQVLYGGRDLAKAFVRDHN